MRKENLPSLSLPLSFYSVYSLEGRSRGRFDGENGGGIGHEASNWNVCAGKTRDIYRAIREGPPEPLQLGLLLSVHKEAL